MITVANAPVSYGVFELDAAEGVSLPGPEQLAADVAAAGYQGIDSGPIGMLGRGEELRDRLARHNLWLAGGFVSLPFSNDEAFAAALPGLRDALDFFAEGSEADHMPLPTFADAGSELRRAHPGGGVQYELDGKGWETLAANIGEAAAIAREAGFEPTFHPHACTHVETPHEIETLLEVTDIGLTFDTGHLLIGGGDVLECLTAWESRINHLHLKDVRMGLIDEAVASGGGLRQVWERKAFVPLGQGDLDIDAVMSAILASEYSGWLVVEQDVIPLPGDDPHLPQHDQITNRQVLKRWLP